MQMRLFVLVCLGFISFALPAIETQDIPEPLKTWVPWVLDENKKIYCPFEYSNFNEKHCTWPGKLTLDVNNNGAYLKQNWQLFEEAWILLPGNDQYWPQDVKVNGKPATVIKHQNRPSLHLKKGNYKIAGRYIWKTLPESLPLPPRVGLVRLAVNGKYIEFPNIEQNGKLWLNEQTGTSQNKEQDRMQVEVFRQVIDDIPLRLVTRIELKVVGKAREVTLGPIFSENYIPLNAGGSLPMQLESNGMLKLQVRPGNWSMQVEARAPGMTDSLSLPASNLPDTELWAFSAKPALRLAEVQGVDAVDPRQTRIPQEWRNLPVYRMDKSLQFKINVKRRGDPDPSPNELSLNRSLWLDFTGKGYTFQDKVSGQMHRGWRLNMNEQLPLGRVEINGNSQLITKTVDKGNQGVEVRHGQIDLVADGRIEGNISTVPAVGWLQDFQQVHAQLNLPPGWRLFSVSGADSAGRSTWVEKWSLLDIFLVLIASAAMYRLIGIKWGLLALLCFTLTWHEHGSPHIIWLLVIASLGLLKVAPPGRLRSTAVVLRYLSVLVLLITILPYMVNTVRTALYPQLAKHSQLLYKSQDKGFALSPRSVGEPQGGLHLEEKVTSMLDSDSFSSEAPRRLKQKKAELFSRLSEYTETYDPKSKVQTGPGLPQWQWTSVPIRWSGPVQQGQMLKLVLLPPWVTALLQVTSVLIVLALSLCLAGVKIQKRRISMDLVKLGVIGMMAPLLLLATPDYARADIPTPELLNELKTRLLKPPECLPACAQISKMKLRLRSGTLSLRLEVHARESVVIPLPGRLDIWQPDQIVMDGKLLAGSKVTTSGLMSAGGKSMPLLRGKYNALWLPVPQGRHQIDISGTIPQVDMLQLPLALKPHHIELDVKGWNVKGVHADGKIEQSLQIERIKSAKKTDKSFKQTILPPFVTVKRIVRLGLDWRVDNEITRITPTGSAIALEVPLLKGESVISETVRVRDGKAIVHFSPADRVVHWQSILPVSDSLALKAADNPNWMEIWNLDVSPVWHAQMSGLPEIHHQSSRGTRFPEWRPWPGEILSVKISKPVGLEGRTLTIDQSGLEITPGKRVTDASLSFRIRSSQADKHRVALPQNITLKEVFINGQTQPIRLESGQVEIPVTPGEQTVKLRWQAPSGVSTMINTPHVNLGTDSVNASIQVSVPRDRWVLLAGGPDLGPAILFWGVLLVVILIAVGLGRTTVTPLKTHHWVLLGVGLTQASIFVALVVVGWVFAVAYREKYAAQIPTKYFNPTQVVLALLTLVTLLGLISTLGLGLLGYPDMQITGNGSSSYELKWYEDRIADALPTAWFVSVSLWFYRGLMLLWSLWLAFALLDWLKWAWQCYTTEGLWRKKELIRHPDKAQEPGDKKDNWKE